MGQVSVLCFQWGQNQKNHVETVLAILKRAPLMAQTVKNLSAMQETWVWCLGQEDPLEKGMATHSSILPWKTPWTEEPGRLQSMGSQRVGHDWVTSLVTSAGETGTRVLSLLLSWIRTSGTQRLKPKQQIFQKTCCQQSDFLLISSLFENSPSCRHPLSSPSWHTPWLSSSPSSSFSHSIGSRVASLLTLDLEIHHLHHPMSLTGQFFTISVSLYLCISTHILCLNIPRSVSHQSLGLRFSFCVFSCL